LRKEPPLTFLHAGNCADFGTMSLACTIWSKLGCVTTQQTNPSGKDEFCCTAPHDGNLIKDRGVHVDTALAIDRVAELCVELCLPAIRSVVGGTGGLRSLGDTFCTTALQQGQACTRVTALSRENQMRHEQAANPPWKPARRANMFDLPRRLSQHRLHVEMGPCRNPKPET